MKYINSMLAAGAVLTFGEYQNLAALNRDDIVMWHEAAAQRAIDDRELAAKGAARK